MGEEYIKPKIFRLAPRVFALAFIWSVVEAILGDEIANFPDKKGGWEAIYQFLVFYFYNGIPRFAAYLFCLGFILGRYKDKKLEDSKDCHVYSLNGPIGLWSALVTGTLIALYNNNGYSLILMLKGHMVERSIGVILWPLYIFMLLFEIYFIKESFRQEEVIGEERK